MWAPLSSEEEEEEGGGGWRGGGEWVEEKFGKCPRKEAEGEELI